MNKNILSMEIELYAARDGGCESPVTLYLQKPTFDMVEPSYETCGQYAFLMDPFKDFINEGALYKVTMKFEFIENPYEKFRKQG